MIFFINILIYLFSWASSPSALIKTHEMLANPTAQFSIIDLYAAGGESAGGGDSDDVRKKTAWFYGTQPIETCVQLSPVFGLDQPQVMTDIQKAISIWQNYFAKKRINDGLKLKEKVNTNFQLKSECVGGEDLVIYLGTGPIFANLDDLRRRQSLSRPVAYVNKTHISRDLKWGKGYIRFVEPELYKGLKNHFPRWNQENAFYNIFLHELGHVLGFDHKEATVMTADISMVHFIGETIVDNTLAIDGSHELHECSSCENRYSKKKVNALGIETVTLDPLDKVLINDVRVDVVDRIKKHPQKSFFKFFPLNDKQKDETLIYFVNYKGMSLSIEKSGKNINIRHQGQLSGEFQKVGL